MRRWTLRLRCLAEVAAVSLIPATTDIWPSFDSFHTALPGTRALPRTCTLREVKTDSLVLPKGIAAYIEPVGVAAATGGLLLAGTYNFLWRIAGEKRGEDVTGDTVFGVFLPARGSVLVVEPPVRAPRHALSGIRLSPRVDGGWDVVWAEQPPGPRIEADKFRGLWYGRFRSAHWDSVQVLPTPPGYQVLASSSSALVRVGDTLAFAVPMTRPAWMLNKVALYTFRRGKWQYTTVNTFDAGEVALSYAGGFVLSVVEPDSTLRSDASSLFLYQERDGWRRGIRLARGPVSEPQLELGSSPGVATWMTVHPPEGSGAVRAIVDPLRSRAVQQLGRGVNAYALVGERDKPAIWLLRRGAGPAFNFDVGSFVRATPAPAGSIESPFFAGVFGVASSGTDGFVLSGPIGREDRDPFVITHLLFYRVLCP